MMTKASDPMTKVSAMKTSELAEQAGVSIHTVRYYESRGLLPEPPRTDAGYRKYGQNHLAHLRFIRRAQELGFTLEQTRELLDLRVLPGAGSEVRAKTNAKISEIDAKIHDLQRIREKLIELADACDRHGSTESCLVLHALEEPPAKNDKQKSRSS